MNLTCRFACTPGRAITPNPKPKLNGSLFILEWTMEFNTSALFENDSLLECSENRSKIDHLAFTIFHGFYNLNDRQRLLRLTDDVKNLTDQQLSSQNLYRLIVQGFASILMILFGVLGNTINIMVLSNPKMRTVPINCLFLGLSLSDTFLLIAFSCLSCPTILSYYDVVDYSTSRVSFILPGLYVMVFVGRSKYVFSILNHPQANSGY